MLGVLDPVRPSIDVAAPASRAPEPPAKVGDDPVVTKADMSTSARCQQSGPWQRHVEPSHAEFAHVADVIGS
jgi:hypothetical protein